MRTSLVALFGFVLCLVLTSCMTESTQPISSPTTAVPDPRFIGDWKGGKDGDEIYRFIPTKTAWMHVVVIPPQTNHGPQSPTSYCDAFPSTIGKNTFLNVLLRDDSGKLSKNYVLLRYKFAHNNRHIRMWTMSQDGPVSAIEAGKLKGKIEEDRFSKNVLLQDTSANILQFIQKSNLSDLFDEELEPLQRVNPAKK